MGGSSVDLIGVAFLLENVFGAVQNLIKISDESCGVKSKERATDLAMATWKGVCYRIHLGSKRDGSTSKFALRLVRMCIDFSFGILTSTSSSAEILDVSTPANQAEQSIEGARVVVASVGFGLEWQLQLLAPLVSGVASPGNLHTVMLHPKGKLFDHINQRMEYLKDMYIQCATVVEKWKTGELQIEFTAKENALPATASSADEEQNNNDKQSPDRSTATIEEKTKAKAATAEDSEKKETKTSDAKVPVLPAGCQSAPPKLRTQRPNLSTSQCIYSDLVGCTEGITLLYRHFPLGFRPFFSFYKVKTIGDLSALPVEKVRTFGLKEPVSTVRRALEEFNGRKDRMKTLTGSPFRRRGGSASSSPAIPTPSPHKPSKRPFHLESGSIAPFSLEKCEHKRTKRSLVLDAEDGEEEESEGTRRKRNWQIELRSAFKRARLGKLQCDVALNEEKKNLLAQTPHWRVRKGTCGGANVVFYSCRLTPLKLELWSVTLETLQQFVAPYPHPNIVQFLGVVTPSEQVQSDAPPLTECVVMEYLPISLYDVLHRDLVSLSRREIALIAIQILRGLLFLHRKHQSFGGCLTSKKVMLDRSNGVKLRRFGLEFVLRSGKAPAQLSTAALKTIYEMTPGPRQVAMSSTGCSYVSSPNSLSPSPSGSPATLNSNGSNDAKFTTVTQDLFAFGILLLEMCTGENPTNELFNRISCAKQIDPVFYSVLQSTLSLGGAIALENRRKVSTPVTTEDLLAMLVANEQQRAKELLDEQKNFAILVLQLEQAQKEKTQELEANQRLQAQLQTSERCKRESDEEIKRLVAKNQEQGDELIALQASLDEEYRKVETLRLARISDAEEKQGLLFEILKLKEDKRKLATEKQEIEAESAAIARKVGGEKEALEDLEGRLVQAIHRWEEEQRVRRRAERQAESTSRQLLQMEEEWCKYSSVLQQSPTGKRTPQASLSYVLALKDKEIEELSRQFQEALDGQIAFQANVARLEAEWGHINEEKDTLLSQQVDAENELLTLKSQIEKAKRSLQNSTSKFGLLIARKLRQCLTPQCDAPRYLVGASGYCKECEERTGRMSSTRDVKQQRHRRHRSWDDASIGSVAVRKNVKNIPIMKLVRVLSGGGSEDPRVEGPDEQQLLEAIKQLTSMLKSDEMLKDDLPECLVIKSVLALMHQLKSSLVLQLVCCRCLSVVVFNHDRNRLIVVAEGGVDPVLAAMKNFPSEPKMQETSCVLLTNLAHNCGKTLYEHVQYYGSWALVNLLSGTERLQAFARREGVREVAEAAHACFPGHEGIQEKTLEILRLLG
ncbi:Armadillo-type fold [Phytophthora cactorum]|nr:Armadillo-type fold [Phytophthora cactorum]